MGSAICTPKCGCICMWGPQISIVAEELAAHLVVALVWQLTADAVFNSCQMNTVSFYARIKLRGA